MKPLTFEQAKQLERGDMLYHTSRTNADGTPQRWRVNGKVKLWKTMPDRIRVPLKYGLYNYDEIIEGDFINGVYGDLSLEES